MVEEAPGKADAPGRSRFWMVACGLLAAGAAAACTLAMAQGALMAWQAQSAGRLALPWLTDTLVGALVEPADIGVQLRHGIAAALFLVLWLPYWAVAHVASRRASVLTAVALGLAVDAVWCIVVLVAGLAVLVLPLTPL